MARRAAEERGDIPPQDADTDAYTRDRELDDDEADEDVNGFMATAAGKRAAAKKKVSRQLPLRPLRCTYRLCPMTEATQEGQLAASWS